MLGQLLGDLQHVPAKETKRLNREQTCPLTVILQMSSD